MNQEMTSASSYPEFERIKRVTPRGVEYWSARDLMGLLGYDTWRSFEDAIDRAKTSCAQLGEVVRHQFADTSKKVSIGSGAEREVPDYFLSRYAAYLIAQNGDPRKPQIAAAQAYFAIQTRRQEIQDNQVSSVDKRLMARERLASSNKRLFGAAKAAGVRSPMFGVFNDEGYKGLYGGRGVQAIKQYKGIPPTDELLDRMGHSELAANDFRATQAEERLRREGIHNEGQAIRVHNEVGAGVRQTIIDQGNTVPEDLPIEPSIKPLLNKKRREARKRIKGRG